MVPVILACFLYPILFIAVNFNPAYSNILYTWSQVAPDDKLSIRAITNDDQCPIAYVNGKEMAMLERDHIEKVCELLVHRNIQDIKVNNTRIPTLPHKVSKIAFIGDTGCMLHQQNCKEDWQLKKNLDSITQHKPDLIIHLGDYHYRSGNIRKCCNNYGDNAQTWYADWFEPAKDILLQTPFLFVRGNHENCHRAYNGWFRYLDAYSFLPNKCENFVSSWLLDIGLMKFFVFDSSFTSSIFTNTNEVNNLNKQFNKLVLDNADKPIWLLTHKPLWRLPKRFLERSSQIEAFGDRFPDNLTAVVSGHIHIAQTISMVGAPDQIISGNGGALLHVQNQKNIYKNIEFNYPNGRHYLANEVKNFFGFGFAILNLDNYILTFYNQKNDEIGCIRLTKNLKIMTM